MKSVLMFFYGTNLISVNNELSALCEKQTTVLKKSRQKYAKTVDSIED